MSPAYLFVVVCLFVCFGLSVICHKGVIFQFFIFFILILINEGVPLGYPYLPVGGGDVGGCCCFLFCIAFLGFPFTLGSVCLNFHIFAEYGVSYYTLGRILRITFVVVVVAVCVLLMFFVLCI